MQISWHIFTNRASGGAVPDDGGAEIGTIYSPAQPGVDGSVPMHDEMLAWDNGVTKIVQPPLPDSLLVAEAGDNCWTSFFIGPDP